MKPEKLPHCVIAFSAFVCLATVARSQTVIYVDDDALHVGDGTSWATAYPFLQDALSDASQRTGTVQIWVAAGTYLPDHGEAYKTSDRSASFTMQNNVELYGGFAACEDPATFDLAWRRFDVHPSILSGDLQQNDLPGQPADHESRNENSYHVVFADGVDPTAILDGFTITAGYADGPVGDGHNVGGGLRIEHGAPLVRNCTFFKSWAKWHGGGVSSRWSAAGPVTFENCVFDRNKAGYDVSGQGGGFYSYADSTASAAVSLTGCVFRNNTALSEGGGFWSAYHVRAELTRCEFRDNLAGPDDLEGDGGGVWLGNSPIESLVTELIDCQFVRNVADRGGAAYLTHAAADFVNTRFISNISVGGWTADNGGAVWCQTSAGSGPYEVNFISCLFNGNKTDHRGGAIFHTMEYPYGVDPVNVVNCTFTHNEAASDPRNGKGGGIFNLRGVLNVSNSILWGNVDEDTDPEEAQITNWDGTVSVEHSCIQDDDPDDDAIPFGEPPDYNFNIDDDPQFTDPVGDPDNHEDDNVRLSVAAGTPCRDGGDACNLPCDEWDVDGDGKTCDEYPNDWYCGETPNEEQLPYDLDGTQRITEPWLPEGAGGEPDMGGFEINCDSDLDCDDGVDCTIDQCLTEYGFCINTPDDEACYDGAPCTHDRCTDTGCENPTFDPEEYYDVDSNSVINLFDIICVLHGIEGVFCRCSPDAVDVDPCDGNEVINVFDVFAVLDAVSQVYACCPQERGGSPPRAPECRVHRRENGAGTGCVLAAGVAGCDSRLRRRVHRSSRVRSQSAGDRRDNGDADAGGHIHRR